MSLLFLENTLYFLGRYREFHLYFLGRASHGKNERSEFLSNGSGVAPASQSALLLDLIKDLIKPSFMLACSAASSMRSHFLGHAFGVFFI